MLSLRLLGGLSLEGDEGPVAGRVTQRRRLALLAVLAIERRLVSRDKLLGLFWPDADSERGRRLLADSLYVLRSGLGDEALLTPGDDVALDESRISTDVGQFLVAIDGGRLEEAARLYSGPFLDGVFVSDAPEFERWADGVRSRLAGEYRRILETLAVDADKGHNAQRAADWWRRLATADPLSTRAALGLMRALARGGDRAAALQYARIHEELVRGELDAAPDPSIAALAERLRIAPPIVLETPPVERPQDAPSAAEDDGGNTARGPAAQRPARNRRHVLTIVAVGVVIVGLAAAAAWRRSAATTDAPTPVSLAATPGRTDADSLPWIAVLPFDAISANPEAEYVADGITEGLTVALDRLQRLHVISRTSATAAKRTGLSAKAIGDTLRARFLVTGSVRLAARGLRINATMTDARDNSVRWSETFDRRFTAEEVLGVEEAVVRAIANALNMRLRNMTGASIVGQTPTNTEAFDLFLRGRHFWDARNLAGTRKAIESFQKAIAKDSTFAPAFVGLADAYATFGIGNVGDFRADEYFPEAAKFAKRALGLDSTLAEAHASLGYVELLYNLDWTAADRELSLALELRPSYSTARIYRAILFEWTGRFDDAVREMERALESDRLSLASNVEMGRALFFAGRLDSAASLLRATLELDSASLRAHTYLGQVYVRQGQIDAGVRELRRAADLSSGSSRPRALLAHAYGKAGRRSEAASLLDSLKDRQRSGYVPAFDFAIIYAGLDSTTRAFELLNQSIDDHSIRPYLMDGTFKSLTADSRYRALLKRLGLPWRPNQGAPNGR